MYEEQVLNSKVLAKASYDFNKSEMQLTFRSNGRTPGERVYAFSDVPKEVFAALVAAESNGKYFNAEIKGKYEERRVI